MIDWDTALAPRRDSSKQGGALRQPAAALKPPPFRRCARCPTSFQRWPLDAAGRPSQATMCPKCVSESEAPVTVGPAGRLAVGRTQDQPIPY